MEPPRRVIQPEPASSAGQPEAAPAQASGDSNIPTVSDEEAQVSWDVPSGWSEGAPSRMRKGSYKTGPEGEIDVAITAFPGDVGGLLANVNRWRGQLNLDPVTEDELMDSIRELEVAGRTAYLFNAAGPGSGQMSRPMAPAPQPTGDGDQLNRIMGLILPLSAETWFFKATGPDDLLAAEQENFMEMVNSIKIGE
jgi:hypothetical protein